MAAFKKGEVVRIKGVVPEGPVQSFRMDEDGEVWCLVEWTDFDGNVQQRWFKQDDLVGA